MIINTETMKNILKKALPMLLIAGILAMTGVQVSCGSSDKAYMNERHQSNKARKIKSNIKVKGTNKANSHTTRSY